MKKASGRVRTAMWLVVFAAAVFTAFQNPERVANAFSYVWSACAAIVAGLCVAFVLNVFMVFIEDTLAKLPRKINIGRYPKLLRAVSLTLTLFFVLGLVALLIVVAAPRITEIIETVISKLPDMITDVSEWAQRALRNIGASEAQIDAFQNDVADMINGLVNYLRSGLTAYATFAFNLTTTIFGGLIDVILSIFVSLYVLSQKERITAAIRRAMRALLSERKQKWIGELSELTFTEFSQFLKGQVTEAFLLGVMCFIGMLIFRFPNAGMISILMGVASLVPVVGPWVGSIVSILLILFVDPIRALFFAIYILVLQQVEDNVLYPRIVGRSMGVPGLLVLCAVIIGGNVYGMFGIVLAVPISGVLYELGKQFVAARLEKKRKQGGVVQNGDI